MIFRLVRLRAWGSEDNEIVILVAIRVGLKPRLHISLRPIHSRRNASGAGAERERNASKARAKRQSVARKVLYIYTERVPTYT